MKDQDNFPNQPKWELAWKVPVQQRIRTFIWLSLHERILCNANRFKRGLTDDPRCKRCSQNVDETILHLLRDCPISRQIWRSVGGTALYPSFRGGTLEQWITRNLKAEGLIFGEKWPTCFATTIWWIWKWRNNLAFGRGEDIPLNTGIFIRMKVEEMWNAILTDPIQGKKGILGREPKHEIFVRWLAPPMDWIALNTDGAAKGSPGQAGGGGVLRDSLGLFIKGFQAYFGGCKAYKAELLALEIGLTMARDMGIAKLLIQMDNQACIDTIKDAKNQGGECHHILGNCRYLCSLFCNVEIRHCFREGNKVADRLANLGVVLQERVVYLNEPPIEVKKLLWEDITGVTEPRFIS